MAKEIYEIKIAIFRDKRSMETCAIIYKTSLEEDYANKLLSEAGL